jgi:hypothetical protein
VIDGPILLANNMAHLSICIHGPVTAMPEVTGLDDVPFAAYINDS